MYTITVPDGRAFLYKEDFSDSAYARGALFFIDIGALAPYNPH